MAEGDHHRLSSLLQSNAVFITVLLILLAVYFGSERSVLHFSRNLRRFYFLTLVGLLSYWGLSAVQNASNKGIEVLMVFVLIVASIVEDKMERAFYLTPFSSAALEFVTGTPEAIGKAELLVEIVGSMNRWQGFSIGLAKQLAWLDGSLHKHQAALHEVLRGADAGEINYILAHNNCAFLLEVAAEKTIDLLTNPEARLRDLTTLSRAILLDGFQKIGLRHRPSRQVHAHRLLLETRAVELSTLKSFLDDAPDHHTTFKLLYNDFQGLLQQKVLKHVSVEGAKALQQFHERYPAVPGMTLKVVSDIDDTLMCSGGNFPAGSDTCFPKGCVYPGVLAFYRGLDAGFARRMERQQERQPVDDAAVRAFGAAGGERQSPQQQLRRTSPRKRDPPPQELRRYQDETQGSSSERAQLRGGSQAVEEGEPSGGLASISESGIWDEDDAESSTPSPSRGQGLLGTDVGAALGAVMPSAGSMQNMVGLTLLARLPGPGAIQPHLQRSLTRERAAGCISEHLSSAQPSSSAHLVFLSARPESYKGFTEVMSFKRIFEPLVRRGDLQGYPVLLLGSLRVGPTALYAYATDRRGEVGAASLQFYQALAAKKLARFKQFAAIYPECCWIFVGDNGQGDVVLAEHLVELLGEKLITSFMHHVVPFSETVTRLRNGQQHVPEELTADWPAKWRAQRIHFGANYISLAAEAHREGLLDDLGLQSVALDACQDLKHVSARFSHSAFDRVRAAKQLNAGIAAANSRLPAERQVPLLREPEATAVTSS